MKINVELNANDLVNADKETLLQLLNTLTGIAQTEVGKPKPEVTSVEVKQAETVKEAEEIKEEVKPAAKKHTKKRASKVEPKTEAPKKEEEVTEDPANNEDPLELDEVPITRDSVKARLKELSVAGKAKEVKKVFAQLNVVKFSELADEQLPEVMRMVEDL